MTSRANDSVEPTGRPTALPRPEPRLGRPAAHFRRYAHRIHPHFEPVATRYQYLWLPLLVLGGIGIGVGWGLFVYEPHLMVEQYATFSEADSAGAIRRGWLPSFTPHSATDLRDVHDLDTNQQWLRFRAPDEDLRNMTRQLDPVPRLEIPTPRQWEGSWVPLNAAPGQMRFYRTPDTALVARCVAVDARASVAYSWTC